MVDLHAAVLTADPLYLDRCQIDTPNELVRLAWNQVRARRDAVGSVVDFGAGDARFAREGAFTSYVGYEVDANRCVNVMLPRNARLIERCAFSHQSSDADLCIGNPPYVRNQDLPVGWRQMASEEVRRRTGVTLSGLANAWQYFLMLALSSVHEAGLVVQVLPYEWVSRPAARSIREWIRMNAWAVDVYRLPDRVFDGVLTAASITVIDKAKRGRWQYHEMDLTGLTRELLGQTDDELGVVPYSKTPRSGLRARRGLSPGTQKALVLTEGERQRAGLSVDTDVVRCITTLRNLPFDVTSLTEEAFRKYYRDEGRKCWLIRTDSAPSSRLLRYLDSLDSAIYQTATCKARETWWRFAMPDDRPEILIAQAFKGTRPKVVLNDVRAVPVGGVAGVYGVPTGGANRVQSQLASLDLRDRVVPYAKQMHKLEINQLNSLLSASVEHPDDGSYE